MQDKLERIVKAVYKIWKKDNARAKHAHPSDEDMTCFLENKLSQTQSESIKIHLIDCQTCAESVAVQLKEMTQEEKEVPGYLIERIKGLVSAERPLILEIFLRIKERAFEIMSTTGDIMVGQELVPAPLLRSRSIKDFKDEVTILKDFPDIRVEVKIVNKQQGNVFNVTVAVKEKDTQRVIKDLRVTLMREELELESYLTDTGRVTFEDVQLGSYTVQISGTEAKLASIVLDMRR